MVFHLSVWNILCFERTPFIKQHGRNVYKVEMSPRTHGGECLIEHLGMQTPCIQRVRVYVANVLKSHIPIYFGIETSCAIWTLKAYIIIVSDVSYYRWVYTHYIDRIRDV